MKKLIISILAIGLVIITIKVGELVLIYTSDTYRQKIQLRTWNERIAEFQEKGSETEQIPECLLKLSLTEDTLIYKMVKIQEKGEGYEAEFSYPQFYESTGKKSQLNKEIELMVFDKKSDSKTYFSTNEKEYQTYFKKTPEDEKHSWTDWEEVILIINSPHIISAIHSDFEHKSGGAIGYGNNVGFNYDFEKGKKISFEELFDSNKLDTLQAKLTNQYKQHFHITSLKENGINGEYIPISTNFYIAKEGIVFLYQRFEHNGIGGGGMRIEIPYCQLIDVLREESVIKKHLK